LNHRDVWTPLPQGGNVISDKTFTKGVHTW